jgi:tetratricopeptide (TPR) repeat protein
MNRGWQFYFAHEYEQAISWFKRTLELEPNFEQAIWALGRSYVQKRMFQEATRELERAVSLSRGSPVYISALGYAHAASGDKQKAQKTLEELKDLSKQRYVSPYWIAMVYAGLGNNDSAFEWLEKAYLEKSGGMVWLQAEPQWDAIRSDPRFQELLVRVGRP